MRNRVKNLWLRLSQNLAFIPGLIVVAFGVLGIALVEVDGRIELGGVSVVFQGNGSAARTVLSVIAGSLITVAGLTFSITIVVLQLAASQFSPRILRTFAADRITQITTGTYVGTFVYSLLVLRGVGTYGDTQFVPRLSVTVASVLAIAAVVLLVVFLNHVSQMIQVSHVTARIAHATLERIDALYPDGFGRAVDDDADRVLERWRERPSAVVLPRRPGYVQRVGVDDLAHSLQGRAERAAILVRPGDFVSVEMPIAEVWPAEALERCQKPLREAVAVDNERDLGQDVNFGVRQLTDIALRALSPGVNDAMTAVTCISYLRSIFVRLSERAEAPSVRRFDELQLTFVVRHLRFSEQLDALRQIGRYAASDAWVARELLGALGACVETARRCGAEERVRALRSLAATFAGQARDEAATDADRTFLAALAAQITADADSEPAAQRASSLE